MGTGCHLCLSLRMGPGGLFSSRQRTFSIFTVHCFFPAAPRSPLETALCASRWPLSGGQTVLIRPWRAFVAMQTVGAASAQVRAGLDPAPHAARLSQGGCLGRMRACFCLTAPSSMPNAYCVLNYKPDALFSCRRPAGPAEFIC